MPLRIIVLAIAAVLSAFGAEDPTRVFYIQRTVTGTANAITIRQPSTESAKRALKLRAVYFKCSVACTWTVSKNGTLSSGSAGTIRNLDERGAAASASATLDGTVGSSTTVSTDSLSAGAAVILDGGLYLPVVSGSQKQFTVSLTSGSSGDLNIYTEYAEPQ